MRLDEIKKIVYGNAGFRESYESDPSEPVYVYSDPADGATFKGAGNASRVSPGNASSYSGKTGAGGFFPFGLMRFGSTPELQEIEEIEELSRPETASQPENTGKESGEGEKDTGKKLEGSGEGMQPTGQKELENIYLDSPEKGMDLDGLRETRKEGLEEIQQQRKLRELRNTEPEKTSFVSNEPGDSVRVEDTRDIIQEKKTLRNLSPEQTVKGSNEPRNLETYGRDTLDPAKNRTLSSSGRGMEPTGQKQQVSFGDKVKDTINDFLDFSGKHMAKSASGGYAAADLGAYALAIPALGAASAIPAVGTALGLGAKTGQDVLETELLLQSNLARLASEKAAEEAAAANVQRALQTQMLLENQLAKIGTGTAVAGTVLSTFAQAGAQTPRVTGAVSSVKQTTGSRLKVGGAASSYKAKTTTSAANKARISSMANQKL